MPSNCFLIRPSRAQQSSSTSQRACVHACNNDHSTASAANQTKTRATIDAERAAELDVIIYPAR